MTQKWGNIRQIHELNGDSCGKRELLLKVTKLSLKSQLT